MKEQKIRIILLLLLLVIYYDVHAASLVQGWIFLKDGTVIECAKDDRIKIPKHSQDIKLFRNAFRKEKSKEVFAYETIDSIVCWHPTSPEHLRKFVPSAQAGWLWIYLETPYISAGVYSAKGYGIAANGGIEVLIFQGLFFCSRTAYYLCKTGDTEFYNVGSTNRKSNNNFRKRIAGYIADDPVLAKSILQSNTKRDKTILMLYGYKNPMINPTP